MGAALAQFAAQAAGSLGPGSAKNIASNVKDALKAARVPIGSLVLCDAVLDGLELAYAEEGADHAIDATEEEVLSWLPPNPPFRIRKKEARAIIWIMCTCGARVADIIRAALSISLDMTQKRLQVIFKVTKTGRSVGEKRSVSFPFFCQPDSEVVNFISSQNFAEVILEMFSRTVNGKKVADCSPLNKVLAAAVLRQGLRKDGKGTREVTTYSFRRLFIQRVISWYTDEDGVIEWMKVIQWSGHKTHTIVSSTYSKGQVLVAPSKPTITSHQDPSDIRPPNSKRERENPFFDEASWYQQTIQLGAESHTTSAPASTAAPQNGKKWSLVNGRLSVVTVTESAPPAESAPKLIDY